MMEPSLPDELLLLALHDTRGSVIPAAAPVLTGTLVGAILMELALRGRLNDNLDGTLSVDPAPTGDEILDEVARRMASAKHPLPGRAWVPLLSRQIPNLKDRLLARLVAAGVLEQRDRRVFWIFPSRAFPLVDGAVEQQARDRLRAVVLDGVAPDRRTAALLSLVRACNLYDEVFAPHERPQARRRTVELINADSVDAGTFGTGLDAAVLFGLAGVTTLYALHQLRQSAGASGDEWAYANNQAWPTDWSNPQTPAPSTPACLRARPRPAARRRADRGGVAGGTGAAPTPAAAARRAARTTTPTTTTPAATGGTTARPIAGRPIAAAGTRAVAISAAATPAVAAAASPALATVYCLLRMRTTL